MPSSSCDFDDPNLHSFPTRRSSDLFKSQNTSLLILDQADVLKRAQVRGDKAAETLVDWLQKIMSIPEIAVRILATSQQSLGWNAKEDRKSTRLNSSHRCISYAVFFM